MIGSRKDCIMYLSDAPDKQYEVEEHHEKRSLSANSYYWTLCSKLAAVLHEKQPVIHNRMIREYGQREIMDGKVVNVLIPDTEEAERTALEANTYHIRPTSQVIKGLRNYVLMRGSSTYDSKEMSVLLDGLVQECKDAGVETLTPDQLEELRGYEKQTYKGLRDKT